MNILTAWKETDGAWSWARLSSSATVAVACYGFLHVVLRNHAIPDAATLVGLGAFGGFPYTVNKVTTAFAKKDAQL